MDHQGSSCLQCFLAFTQHSMLSPLWVSVPVPEAPALHRDSFTRLTLSHPFTDLLPTSLKKSFPCVPSLPQTGLGGIHWTAKENFSSSLQNSLCHLMSSCDKVSTRSAKLKKSVLFSMFPFLQSTTISITKSWPYTLPEQFSKHPSRLLSLPEIHSYYVQPEQW